MFSNLKTTVAVLATLVALPAAAQDIGQIVSEIFECASS